MSVIQLKAETSYDLLKKAIGNFSHSGNRTWLSSDGHKSIFGVKQRIERALNRPLTYKSIVNYMINALAEGLKQNLFGPNVNMEFVTLTIKVYSTKLIDSL